MSRFTTSAITLALCAVLLGVGTPQLNQWEDQIRLKLGDTERVLLSLGYEQAFQYHVGTLRDDAEETFSLVLRDDREYPIVSVCDIDCHDIDLYVYDENGQLIDQDEKRDVIPVLYIRPRWTGEFRIRVKMFDCGREPCYFGIGVFARPSDGTVPD